MNTTPLSFLIDNMNVHRDIANLEDGLKVRAIDAQIRELRQGINFPWNLVKGTLRVFGGVLEYPITADHDELGYIDSQNINTYSDSARFYSTSLQQFYENVNSGRNLLADIWKDGTRLIGLRDNQLGLGQALLSSSANDSDYTASGDASGVALDQVFFKSGNASIQFTITNSSNVATLVNTINISADTNYQKKYHFREIYLDSVPTSIELRLETDGSNYLSKVVTTQFSGEAFKADDWNLIAMDLNEATETGTFDSSSITQERTIITGASTGTYYLGQSSLREWKLMDKWYYSKYNVVTSAATTPDKEYFISTSQSTADVDQTDKLLGDSKWFDLVLWGAMERLMAEVNNVNLFSFVQRKLKDSREKFNMQYPTMRPIITTKRYNFNNDPLNTNLNTWRD